MVAGKAFLKMAATLKGSMRILFQRHRQGRNHKLERAKKMMCSLVGLLVLLCDLIFSLLATLTYGEEEALGKTVLKPPTGYIKALLQGIFVIDLRLCQRHLNLKTWPVLKQVISCHRAGFSSGHERLACPRLFLVM